MANCFARVIYPSGYQFELTCTASVVRVHEDGEWVTLNMSVERGPERLELSLAPSLAPAIAHMLLAVAGRPQVLEVTSQVAE